MEGRVTTKTLKRLERAEMVTARCIGCGMTRDIGPNEIAPGDHPCCASCGMPMIAESAQRKGAKRKRK
jgi:hypothetical protein